MPSQTQKPNPVPAKTKWLFIAAVTAFLLVAVSLAAQLFDDLGNGDAPGRQRLLSLSPISDTIDQENPVFQRLGLLSPDGCAAVLDYYQQNALEQVTAWGLDGGWSRFDRGSDLMEMPDVVIDAASESSGVQRSAAEPEFSPTNIQVEGVDEADIVKTDGNHIYVLTGGAVKIITAAGPDNPPVVLAEVGLDFYGIEMLLSAGSEADDGSSDSLIIVGRDGSNKLRLVQINIDDRQAPAVAADFSLDGNYVGIRLAGQTVRLVTASWPLGFDWATPSGSGLRAEAEALEANQEIIRDSGLDNWLPAYQDNLLDDSEPAPLMDCSRMLVPSIFSGLNTLSIITFNASEKLIGGSWGAVGLAADGQHIYATADNVYVATTETADDEPRADVIADDFVAVLSAELKTVIHKFGLEPAGQDASVPPQPVYLASGEVDGSLLNQFSMDEYQGDLRLATTLDNFDQGRQENHVKILRPVRGVFDEIGAVTSLGIDERIFAVRFMGPQAYLVTFRQIDPLYALDLSDPANPKALGELKIPGFSSYLHPVGDNLLLGIGQEADLEGRRQGLQLSLFDTSEPTNPRRVSQLLLEDALAPDQAGVIDSSRSSSPAERDHRAFLYWQESAFIPYDISWISRAFGVSGSQSGILVVNAKGRTLTVETDLTAVRQKDGQPDREIYLRPIRTVVIDDLVYGITGDELAVWPIAGGGPVHIVDY